MGQPNDGSNNKKGIGSRLLAKLGYREGTGKARVKVYCNICTCKHTLMLLCVLVRAGQG